MTILTRLTAGDPAVAALGRRSAVPDRSVRDGARRICDSVRTGGDTALAEAASAFGGGRAAGLVVGREEQEAALASLDEHVVAAMRAAIGAISRYHEAQRPEALTVTTFPGVTIERRWSPLRRAGAYVPGGKAAYPSTLLMTVVPAKVAGVAHVSVASPAGPDGSLSQVLLGAAALCDVDALYAMGGAQAIAALAYGTESVTPVEKIVGPGNAWVTAAKLAVLGDCAIDLPAGPSEVLVVADETADPRVVAVDLLCQAEHGPDSPAVLVTADPGLPDAVDAALAEMLPGLARREILAKALADHGTAVVTADLDEAVAFANDYAAEHVTVLTADAERDAARIHAAGSVYVGHWSPESAGDYATGANHVLPTGGLAGAYGPLDVEDFGSWRQIQRIDRSGLEGIRPTIEALATAEGLTAHRLAATLRFEDARR